MASVQPSTRARRALTATKSMDENAVRALSNQALQKGAKSVLGVSKIVNSKDNGKITLLGSKSTQAPRRALGDVSNVATALHAKANSKDLAAKPHAPRSRPGSQSSIASVTSNASSKTTGNKTNRHVKSLSAASGRNVLASQSSNANLERSRARSAQAPGAPKLRQGPWHGAAPEEEEGVEVLKHDDTDMADSSHLVSETDARHLLPAQSIIASSSDIQGLGLQFPSSTEAEEAEEQLLEEGASEIAEEDSMEADEEIYHEQDEGSDGYIAHSEMLARDPDNWMLMDPSEALEAERIVEEIKKEFKDELDFWDTTMVAEYSDEIFEYMASLEASTMPNPNYMSFQNEIEWSSRTTLIEWLLQIHMRYHMLPETLWIAINIIDRFLSNRVVSLVKLQLVGITAMFVAAKYEEIMAPSVEEFVALTDNGYSKEEILKGERIMLQSLDFNISPYCTPYSWVRRISKADDYDIQTRTLSKFLMEVTLLDYRFLRAKPSMIAAIGMYAARKMLGAEWSTAFCFYSGFTEAQLEQPTLFLVEALAHAEFELKFVYKKYSTKKFLKASIFAVNWARTQFQDA